MRLLASSALLLALGWISLRALLPPYLESRLVSALRAAGFPGATLRVVRADLSGAELVGVSLWPDARASSVRIEYGIADLLRGRIAGVRIRQAEVRLPLSSDELADLMVPPSSDGTGDDLPLRWLAVDQMRIHLVRPGWTGEVQLAGRAAVSGRRVDFAAHGRAMDGLRFAALGTASDGPAPGVRLALVAGTPGGRWLTGATTIGPGGLSATLAGESEHGGGEVSLWSRTFDRVELDWRLEGPVPRPALAAAGFELAGDRLETAGRAIWRPSSPTRLSLVSCALTARADRAVSGVIALDQVAIALSLSGEVGRDRTQLFVDPGSSVRAATLRLGRGDTALETGRFDGALEAQGPFLLRDGPRTAIAGALRALGPVAMTGSVRGRLEQARIELAASGAATSLRLAFTSRALRLAGTRSSLERVDGMLPIGDGAGRPRGWLRGDLRARGHRLGRARFALGWRAGGLALDGALALSGGGRVSARGRVRPTSRGMAGRLHLAMPPTRVDLARLVAPWTHRSLSGHATVSLTGDLDLRRRAPHGSLQVIVAGGAVQVGSRVRFDGVSARLDLAELFPLSTRGEQQVRFTRGRLGAVPIDGGSIGLAVAGAVPALRAEVRGLGGSLRTSIWTPHRGRLEVAMANVDVARILPLLSRTRLRGTGRLDGELSLEVQPGSAQPVRVRSGRLTTRGGGRIITRSTRLTATLAARASDSLDQTVARLIRERIGRALADFDYSRLSIDLAPRGEQLALRADLRGRGHRVPQEISVVLRARGVESLIDPLLNSPFVPRSRP